MILTPPIACKKPKGKRHGDKTNPPAKKEKTEADEGYFSRSVKWELKGPESERNFADTNASDRKAVDELLDLFHSAGAGYIRGKEKKIKEYKKKFRLDHQKSYEMDSIFAVFHVQKDIESPSTVAAAHVEIPGDIFMMHHTHLKF
uniref:Uncharacterized protein n=1 Tax=Amphimedon queenslandica TaxID=400682 RepID=A0A1X7TWQ2_AMPQE